MPVAAGLYYIYHDTGAVDQPPVVLIHGAGGDHLSWPVQLRRLASQRVIIPDLCGHGKSSGFACQSISDYADQLGNFLDALNIYRVILVGHSMGGAVAMQLSLEKPEQVVGLGLISTAAALNIVPDLMDDLQTDVPMATVLRKLKERLYSPYTDPQIARKGMELMGKLRPTALYVDWLACHNFNIEEDLSELKMPTWIAAGKEDRLVPYYQTERLVHLMPDAQITIIPKAGHMVIVEQPDIIAKELTAFINNLPKLKNYGWKHTKQ